MKAVILLDLLTVQVDTCLRCWQFAVELCVQNDQTNRILIEPY